MNISENLQDTNNTDPYRYNIVPAWTDHTTRLDKDFGINYKGDGWYQYHGDWMLINKTLTGFKIMVWDYDPRPFFKKVAEAEVRT